MRKLAVILPTYNEEKNILKLIEGIFANEKKLPNWEIHVIVVDSSSPDQTQAIVLALIEKYPKLHLLRTKKEGLGKAYVQGFTSALERLNLYLIFEMDADMSHNPKEIPHFVQKIEQGADFVIGSRYMKGGSIPKNWPIQRKIYSTVANLYVRFAFMKLKITDWTSGYRAIKSWLVKNAIDQVKDYSGYVFQVALLDFAVKNKSHIEEVPIQFIDRIHGKSKINSFQYIIQTLFYVLSHSSFIKYAIVGLIGFTIDFGISYIGIEKLALQVWIATLISTEISIISNFLLNNFWSFSHKKLEHTIRSYLPNFLKFNLVSSGSIVIQTVGVQLLTMFFARKFWYIYKVCIIAFIIIPYSYILYNKFIWKDK